MSHQTARDGKQLAQATWGSSPTGWTAAKQFEPGTKEFFDQARQRRSEYEIPWLDEVFDFSATKGKRVLDIGCGPGWDAYSFSKAGAIYKGIDITPENIVRTKSHLRIFGYDADVQQGDAENLPFDDNMFDVVYSCGVMHHTPSIENCLSEASRVLRTGGEAFIILYYKDSLYYRFTLAVWEQVVMGNRRKETLAERLSRIEANEAGEKPIVNVYSKDELTNLFTTAGFKNINFIIRKLNREDLPQPRFINRIYRLIPQALLDAIGRKWGWYICVSATKS
jgi:ubiquinone/menaquinone biosynthesis C-methylase UbiE